METWVSGNLTALTERSQPAIRWRVGEVANRVSCGSFRGGHWYLPIRNHDNRYFADWIRLCPGLSKNSENGNSCPKPHKAARMIEAVGGVVSIETETIIAIWILPRRSSQLYKGKFIKMETKMDKNGQRVACKNWNVYSPQKQNNLIFFWLPYSGLGKAVAGIYPGSAMQLDALAFLPHPYRHYRHCPPPPPDHSPLFASIRWPGQAGLTSAGSVAAGSDGCLLGRIHFPCGYVVYVLLCCWGVFPVLTLYSPRSIVWGLFFSPHFPHVNAVFFFNSTCISLLIILVWLCMWRIIKNLEPWTYHIKHCSFATQIQMQCVFNGWFEQNQN